MTSEKNAAELYRKYRPRKLTDVFGQDAAVEAIQKWLDGDAVPHAIGLTGPSGTGKTTIARILRRKIGAGEKRDFKEINCADKNGIDSVREIQRGSNLYPIGKARMYLLDEAHQLTSQAQNGLLKILEDPPEFSYFVICTTDPQKLINTIHTRLSIVALRSLAHAEIVKLVLQTCKAEGKKLDKGVVEKLADHADGSARRALVILGSIIGLSDTRKQINLIESSDAKTEAIQIARALIDSRTDWRKMSALLKNCNLGDAEGMRNLVLSYCTSVLLGDNKKLWHRAGMIIDFFSESMFYSKRAGFVHKCWEVLKSG